MSAFVHTNIRNQIFTAKAVDITPYIMYCDHRVKHWYYGRQFSFPFVFQITWWAYGQQSHIFFL